MKSAIIALLQGKTREQQEQYIASMDKLWKDAEDPTAALFMSKSIDIAKEFMLKGGVYDTKELMQALEEGKILVKGGKAEGEELYFFYTKKHKMFEKKGWGSAFGTTAEVLYDIFVNPGCWRVHEKTMEQGYPYPWSTVIGRTTV